MLVEAIINKTPFKTNESFHFNGLACPYCCNKLHDCLFDLELKKDTKTVKCSNSHCDYLAVRNGFILYRLGK